MAEPHVHRVEISSAPTKVMRLDRGTTIRLVDPDQGGASNIDLHINVLNVDSGPGPYHFHAKSENVYIVLEGTVWAIIEGEKHVLTEGDVVFIPPGVKHAAGNGGEIPARVIEIYAPPGPDFNIVEDDGGALALW